MSDQQQRLERLKQQMRLLREELISLLTDQDVYWKTQAVIKSNARLMTMRSPFFDLFNDSFVYSTVMGLRRITERSNQVVSLLNVLCEIKQYPKIAPGIDFATLCEDIDKLKKLGTCVRDYADKYVAHHDRNRQPTQLTLAKVQAWTEAVQEIFHRYYATVMQSDIDLIVAYLEDPMRIFTFAWK